MKRGLWIAVVATALALAVASCGGGGSNESTTTAPTETSAQSESSNAANAGGAAKPQPKHAKKPSSSNSSEPPKSTESSSTSEPESESGQPSGEGQKNGKKPNATSPEKRFAQQANAICIEQKKQLLTKLGEYLKEHASQANKQEALLEATQAVLVPGMEAQIVAIRKLETPPDSARQVDAFLAIWQRSLDTAAKSSKPMLGSYATELLAPAGDRARKLGLGKCAYG